jgi:hypothetical protein
LLFKNVKLLLFQDVKDVVTQPPQVSDSTLLSLTASIAHDAIHGVVSGMKRLVTSIPAPPPPVTLSDAASRLSVRSSRSSSPSSEGVDKTHHSLERKHWRK